MVRISVSMLFGIVLAFVSTKILFVGSGLNLLPWGLVGLATGIYAKTKKEALVNGAIYGFVLSFVFMVSGYTGAASVFSRLPFFALLGLFGALCGTSLGIVGYVLFSKYGKAKKR